MRLLLIMPTFFEYPQEIISELNRQGYQVDLFDDRPSQGSLMKAAIRINKTMVSRQIKKYERKIISSVSSVKYDVCLLISGQSLSLSFQFMKNLRDLQTNAKFVLYMWDSLKNFVYIERFFNLFDSIYSFDPSDCKSNGRVQFLPLFYTRSYGLIGRKELNNRKFDLLFVGTAHPQKYSFIKKISEDLRPVLKRQMIYFYMPSKLLYFYRKITNAEFAHTKLSEINFNAISSTKLIRMFGESNIILDAPQKNQIGLTIRCIETLGARRKLITTNKSIVNYDFYRPENILVYNGSVSKDDVFFKSPYVELEQSVYEEYSLKSWVKRIIEQ